MCTCHSPDVQDNPAHARMERGMTRPLKPVPIFKQQKGETDNEFMRRVHKETETVISMAKFEDKYDVCPSRNTFCIF